MPTMTIRRVNPDTYTFYREQAARKGHSMEEEVRQVLERNKQQDTLTGADFLRKIRARFDEIGGADDLADILDNLPRPPAAAPITFDE